jgi:hypothetical protein
MKNTILKMVNLWWADSIVDEDGDRNATLFKIVLEDHFPELQFTYSIQNDEWLLLTEC